VSAYVEINPGVHIIIREVRGGVPSYVEQYQATQVEVSSPPKLFFILPG
jgi:hypothetical protein